MEKVREGILYKGNIVEFRTSQLGRGPLGDENRQQGRRLVLKALRCHVP